MMSKGKEKGEGQEEKVVDIRSRQPHMTGGALCLNCGNEWMAVEEVGESALDCPSCGTWQGVWKGICMPNFEDKIWECNCGCRHFFLSRSYFHCCHCGLSHTFEEGEEE